MRQQAVAIVTALMTLIAVSSYGHCDTIKTQGTVRVPIVSVTSMPFCFKNRDHMLLIGELTAKQIKQQRPEASGRIQEWEDAWKLAAASENGPHIQILMSAAMYWHSTGLCNAMGHTAKKQCKVIATMPGNDFEKALESVFNEQGIRFDTDNEMSVEQQIRQSLSN